MIPAPEVITTGGRVRGRRHHGIDAYLGIPYAGPGPDPARFAAPAAFRGWTGVREATALAPACPQPEDWFSRTTTGHRAEPQDERCWALNVWTPGSGGERPVLVWVHGGVFRVGSGGWPMYDGRRLARFADAVVVTVNHRLDVFGFLGPLPEDCADLVPNVGLLDIVAALEWVRDNIAELGGDPRRVVLAGQSGGAGKISAVLAMPATRSLFRTAVLMSGARPRLATADQAGEASERLLRLVDGDVRALRRMPAADLVNLSLHVARDQGLERGGSFAPWVDGCVVRGHPGAELQAGAARQVRLVAGCARDEATLLHAMAGEERPFRMSEPRARAELARLGVPDDVADRHRAANPALSTAQRMVALHTDLWRRRDVYRILECQTDGGGEAYAYEFHRDAVPELGATHGADLPYLFRHLGQTDSMGHAWTRLVTPSQMTADDEDLSRLMARTWTGLAEPDGPLVPGLGSWPAYRPDDRQVLVLGGQGGAAVTRGEVPDGFARVWGG